MLIETLPTPFIFFIGAVLLLLLPREGLFRAAVLLIVPLLAFAQILTVDAGNLAPYTLFGLELEAMRVDPLSRIFALIFATVAFLGNLYAAHLRDPVQQVAALLYAGSVLGATLAGDLVTLFFYWEGAAITSVFLIWARGTEGAYHTGLRYLVMQITSGVVLLAGLILHYNDTGSVAFEAMTLGSLATWCILLGFGIKCAFPLVHGWLQDAYPAATVTGTVILSGFTTKLAVYTLARGFPGTEILVYVGAVMALFPLFFAMVENNLRRVLAFSLNTQLGFMVVGVGIGTELALNGAVAHAVVGVLYTALLFMAVGAVLYRTGTAKASELGGLYRTMPVTMALCVVGAASISAVPLFAGFVSKSLIISDAAHEGHYIVWAILYAASVGVFVNTGLRVPIETFFGKDSGKRPAEAPRHMLLAMGLTAVLCVGVGTFPSVLYGMLPYDEGYKPYTVSHIVTQLQLLVFAALAALLLVRSGIYPRSSRGTLLNFDWVYRRGAADVVLAVAGAVADTFGALKAAFLDRLGRFLRACEAASDTPWPAGAMAMNIAALLGVALLVMFVS